MAASSPALSIARQQAGLLGPRATPLIRLFGRDLTTVLLKSKVPIIYSSAQTKQLLRGGGFISQALTTVAFTEYDLSFALAAPFVSNDLSVLVTVTSDGGTDGDLFSETITFSAISSYTTYDRTFTATNTSSTLRFLETSTNTNSKDPFLDDVSVSVVPEPGTYALLAGLTGLAFVMVRRRRA